MVAATPAIITSFVQKRQFFCSTTQVSCKFSTVGKFFKALLESTNVGLENTEVAVELFSKQTMKAKIIRTHLST